MLLPGGPLQLQVFEPRYLDMVGRCMRTGTPFGVVRILAGSEAGAASDMAATGTSARIIDFTPCQMACWDCCAWESGYSGSNRAAASLMA